MPKSNNISKPPADERRLTQRGKVVVSKFLALMQQTDAKGLLIIEATESGKKTLLSITSGLDWKEELENYKEAALDDTITLHLRAQECVIQEKREDLRKSSDKRQPLTWMAKLPVEGAAQQVRKSIGETSTVKEPELSTVDILKEKVEAYFGDPFEENQAIQKMRSAYELEPVPSDAYLEFPQLKIARHV